MSALAVLASADVAAALADFAIFVLAQVLALLAALFFIDIINASVTLGLSQCTLCASLLSALALISTRLFLFGSICLVFGEVA